MGMLIMTLIIEHNGVNGNSAGFILKASTHTSSSFYDLINVKRQLLSKCPSILVEKVEKRLLLSPNFVKKVFVNVI